MPLISIAVPCYNVEDYIDRCIDSLVRQTIGFENLEIILVNDASTDHTLEKLERWEQRYPEQIVLISLDENMRQGYGRNLGIRYASADYIGFVDADDWVEPEMCQMLYDIAVRGFDVVRGKNVRDQGDGQALPCRPRDDQAYHFAKKGGFYDHDIPREGNNGRTGGVWNALYRKSLIVDHDVWFPEKLTYEDNYWGPLLSYYISSEYIVDVVLYHYFVNRNSTILTKHTNCHYDRLRIELMKLDVYRERGIFEWFPQKIEMDFIQLFFLNSLHTFFTRLDDIPAGILNSMKRIVVEQFPDYRSNPGLMKCNAIEKTLLRLLDFPRDLTADEWKSIQTAYVEQILL